ncbi:hypothetical protein, partial [Paenibacillus polymyxa]|uniref:hypothetical protein n=1 Tax=Paenibacillus polymyxa TaxID=1406 RepID=UPI001C3FF787
NPFSRSFIRSVGLATLEPVAMSLLPCLILPTLLLTDLEASRLLQYPGWFKPAFRVTTGH